jgi:hypothetical protein
VKIPGVKEAVETFLKWLDDHFSFRYFAMFFILSLAFLLGINPFLAWLGLPPVPPAYRVIAAIMTLIFGCGSGLFSLEAGYKRFAVWRDTNKYEELLLEHLHNLPVDHLKILLGFSESGKNSLLFYPSNGVVCELQRLGILYRASNLGNWDGPFAYNLTPVAAKYLRRTKFQEILLNQRPQ